MDPKVDLAGRRFDLDWLRVLAILMVFVFHTTRFFDPMDWHVKNATTYQALELTAAFFTLWGMPFIFVISGASLFFALKRSRLEFIGDKVRRLLVPLLVGVFTFSAIQVYLERLTHHQFTGTLLEFIPHYFEGWYGFGGNFAWMGMHLWYLEILFLYSLLLMPLFYWFKQGTGKQSLIWIGNLLERPFMVFSIGIPVAVLLMLLDPVQVWGARAFGGWSFVPYILFLLAGFVIISHTGVQARIVQYRYLALAGGVTITGGLVASWQASGEPPFGTWSFALFFLLFGIGSWCWIQAILGFGFKYLNTPHPILAIVGEAVLPFYILHQTVILLVGLVVVQWGVPDLLKWAIIAVVSFVVILLVYEFAIRRINLLRSLFGMRPIKSKIKALPETDRTNAIGTA